MHRTLDLKLDIWHLLIGLGLSLGTVWNASYSSAKFILTLKIHQKKTDFWHVSVVFIFSNSHFNSKNYFITKQLSNNSCTIIQQRWTIARFFFFFTSTINHNIERINKLIVWWSTNANIKLISLRTLLIN